jgi:hypothetical protein
VAGKLGIKPAKEVAPIKFTEIEKRFEPMQEMYDSKAGAEVFHKEATFCRRQALRAGNNSDN